MEMQTIQKLKGRLMYLGWSRPWKLTTDEGEIDLWPTVEGLFVSLCCESARQELTTNSYELLADESSEFKFEYVPGKYPLLKGGEGWTNIQTILDKALIFLSGRLVEIEIEYGEKLKIAADPSENVFGVYFSDNNSCKVPKGAEQTICKIERPDCCIFLSFILSRDRLGDNVYCCEKFNSPAQSQAS